MNSFSRRSINRVRELTLFLKKYSFLKNGSGQNRQCHLIDKPFQLPVILIEINLDCLEAWVFVQQSQNMQQCPILQCIIIG
ncbi:MAG: hypothetical protein PHX38_07260 [Sulfuricella sp.]|nr:hypothetical protein [Sulfuricella sp.]